MITYRQNLPSGPARHPPPSPDDVQLPAIKGWSPAEVKELVALAPAGVGTVAMVTGRSEEAVTKAMASLVRRDLAPPRDPERTAPRERRPTRRRPCLCCGSSFHSEGPHNRLCQLCRRRES